MKIARVVKSDRETFGLVKDGKIATKDDITQSTGIPIPMNIRDFLFDGNKPRTALNGTNAEIICPNFVKELDYEIELALIIGKKCKNISEEEAMDVIFGYMILNDVSARDIQAMDKQFTRAKSFDGFAPCGPWITTKDEIDDPQNLKLTTKINGQIRQDSTTSNMFIKIPSIISILSKSITLEPGDIISTGTAAGVALNNPNIPYLKDGDHIEMEIEKIGTIQNKVRFVD
jgi:2-keto-4-pentenoate hydratase/2-oxohepta-3-ene-1,7-dioic acid hydratase in catechol pathway